MRRKLSLLLAVVMILGSFSFAFADEGVDVPAFLKENGILVGNESGDLMLDDYLLRKDAVVLLARLLDKEDEAENFEMEGYPTFTDLAGNPYYNAFLAWAEYNGYFNGRPDGSFGYNDNLEAVEYALVLLRALEYGEDDKAEEWAKAWDLAEELGLLENVEIERRELITRRDVAQMTFNALGVEMKEEGITLAEFLGIELPKEPEPEELEVVEVYSENLIEVAVELSNAKLADEEKLLDENNYKLAGYKVEKVTLDGNTVIVLLNDALVKGRKYDLVVRNIDKDVNGTYKFEAKDNTIPKVEKVEVLGEYGIKVITSEPVDNPQERNFLIDGVNIAMEVEQYGRVLVLTPYYDKPFPEDAETLTIKELEDYAGYKTIEEDFEIEMVKDEVAPEVVDVVIKGNIVEVTFDKDIFIDSVSGYINRNNTGNISYKDGRQTIYTIQYGGEKVDVNKARYTFDREIPRRAEITIEGVANHSDVEMEKVTTEGRIIVDYTEPEIIDVKKHSYVRPQDDEGNYLVDQAGLTIEIYFDKDVTGVLTEEATKNEKKAEDLRFEAKNHFDIYIETVHRRNLLTEEEADYSKYIKSVKYGSDRHGIRKDIIVVELQGLNVNNSDKDYNYVLEVRNFADTTILGNRMYRDYVDFDIPRKSPDFKVVDVDVEPGKAETEIVIEFSLPVDRVLAEDPTNYLFRTATAVYDVEELKGRIITEKDGYTVTLILPEFNVSNYKTLEILPVLKDVWYGNRLTGARVYDFASGELLGEGQTPGDKAKEAEQKAIKAILDAEGVDAFYSALVAAGMKDVRVSNLESYKKAINALDPEKITLKAIQEAIDSVNDSADKSQLIFDINRINGEGNMSKKLAELEVEAYDELTEIQKVEVAKLFIIKRGVTPEETATEKVVREDYNSIEKIVNKLNEAITDYKNLLKAVNNATTLDAMKTALEAALEAAGATEADDALTILAVRTLDSRPEGGYKSFTEILEAIKIK